MAQATFGVVVLVEGDAALEVQALRRALSDPGLEQIRPHVTLVPPVQLQPDQRDEARAMLVAAAAAAQPFAVELGPPATFWPVSATVHLPVVDPEARLTALRQRVFRPPLWRDTHPFVPHTTLLTLSDESTIEQACRLLGGFRTACAVTRLTLLELHHEPRRWEVAFDVDLDGVRVLGGGPLALQLVSGTVAEADARELLAAHAPPRPASPASPDEADDRGSADTVVVTARREGAVVGVARGHIRHGLDRVVVDRHARRQGIGTQLRREWSFRAERRAQAVAVRAAGGASSSFS